MRKINTVEFDFAVVDGQGRFLQEGFVHHFPEGDTEIRQYTYDSSRRRRSPTATMHAATCRRPRTRPLESEQLTGILWRAPCPLSERAPGRQ